MPTAQRDRPTYEDHEPKFLAKLRQQAAGGGFEERDRPHANRRIVTRVDDEEDGPTYVDEESNRIVSKAEYDALVAGEVPESQDANSEATNSAAKSEKPRDEAARAQLPQTGANQRKRKAVKVGAEEDDEAKSSDDSKPKPRKADQSQKKPKKKIKPVGLSFEHDS